MSEEEKNTRTIRDVPTMIGSGSMMNTQHLGLHCEPGLMPDGSTSNLNM
jgi:hypothetical protein